MSSSNKSNLGDVSHDETSSDSFFKAATDISSSSKDRIPTGSKNFDDLLSGGLEPTRITQIYGEPNTGKTHLCHLICVVLPYPYKAIYIDTERSFRRRRIESIAKARGLNEMDILRRIQVAQAHDSKQQELCIEKACSSVRSDPRIKIVIVDSFMSHYRSDYPESSQLPERASRLCIYLNKLSTLAHTNNIVVIITNQNASYRRAEYEPKPFGGNIISYASGYIIRLEYVRRSAIDAILVKSPLQGYKTCHLTIVEEGFHCPYALK